MKIDEYKGMMDKMVIPEGMDKNLKRILITDHKEKNKMKNYKCVKRLAAAVASAVLIFGLSQTELVSNAAATIKNYFQYGFIFTKDDGKKSTVNMKMEYLTLDKNAPMEAGMMDSIDQVSDAIGIRLLNTKMENHKKDSVDYFPMVSEDNKLYGAVVTNKLYSYGDLKNIGIDPENGGLAFDEGNKFKTPVGVQIAVRTDKNLTQKYENNELGFVSENQTVDLDDEASKAEVYEISNLGVRAVIFTTKTDGPIIWGIEDGKIECTNAIFVYKGVEYLYYGGMTHDTMKSFLELLN